MMHETNENHESRLTELLQSLPRVNAPDDFEQVTQLRVLLDQLPRAQAPESFEDDVLMRLREDESSRRRLRLRRLPRSMRWLAAGVGAAIVGGVAYYLATRTDSRKSSTPAGSTPPPAEVTIPLDSGSEERLAPPQTVPTTPQRPPKAVEQQSTPPGKRITPGAPDEND
ncbi:MAG: hypothetical protein KatS3mg038_0934 [Candidatus Kapaibacterium sp.]|nr:MAG: hypothetical protein KatS3mg038_0934 [Candidatus Kapabacteria bacterium]